MTDTSLAAPTTLEVSVTLPPEAPLRDVAALAQRVERLGVDTVQVAETLHDPFTVSTLVLEHTTRLRVRTSMVVAFARSPMLTAYAAWDLARFSAGRFDLGLATQVRGNIVDRYSATWVDPVGQLRDYVASVRAIFAAFQGLRPLEHEGPHYAFRRLQPYFNPGPLDVPAPRLWTGGVGPAMCALAGEVSDGFVAHPTASHPRVLTELLVPDLERGAARSGRNREGLQVVANVRPFVGRTDAEVDAARDAGRQEAAFLYATPAYRRQLDLLGYGDLGERLSAMAAAKQWDGLSDVLTDEVVADLVVHATYAELPAVLAERYAGRCAGVNLALPADAADDDAFAAAIAAIRQLPSGAPFRPAGP